MFGIGCIALSFWSIIIIILTKKFNNNKQKGVTDYLGNSHWE